MNNNQNFQQPQGQYQGQPNAGYGQPQQPYQGNPNMGYGQPQNPYYGNPNMGYYQQPPKKKMSAGCIVALVLGILFLIGLIIAGALIAMGVMVFNSAVSEFDSIGSEIYNTAFELYLGEEKPARSVTSLMASVRANNEDEEETNKIKVEIELSDGITMDYNSYDSDRIPKDSNYFIEAEKNSKGYISEIYIEEL